MQLVRKSAATTDGDHTCNSEPKCATAAPASTGHHRAGGRKRRKAVRIAFGGQTTEGVVSGSLNSSPAIAPDQYAAPATTARVAGFAVESAVASVEEPVELITSGLIASGEFALCNRSDDRSSHAARCGLTNRARISENCRCS